jgi:hypothetical protein
LLPETGGVSDRLFSLDSLDSLNSPNSPSMRLSGLFGLFGLFSLVVRTVRSNACSSCPFQRLVSHCLLEMAVQQVYSIFPVEAVNSPLILGVCILLRVRDQGESVFRLRNVNIVGFLLFI